MKKIIGIFICVLLFVTIIPFHIQANENYYQINREFNEPKYSTSISFSTPRISNIDNYTKVNIMEIKSNIIYNNQLSLPVLIKTITFPFNTSISSINCKPRNIQILNMEKNLLQKQSINSKNYQYPMNWMSEHIGVGLYNGERVIILTLELFPVCFNFDSNELLFASQLDISINYDKLLFPEIVEQRDMLVISPEVFKDELQPLINHKVNHGLSILYKSTEEIYNQYEGLDQQEQIKYCIKDAIESYDIKYVLLVGGMNHQRWWSWHIPVRYSNLVGNYGLENSYVSDLYYADVYKYDEGQPIFDDWDSNCNGIFAEWTQDNKDVLDMYPDVCIGRLPCRKEKEVTVVVNKIINYENTAYGQEWFNRMVVIGGDNHNDNVSEFGYSDYIEGQLICDKALTFMDGFDKTRIYVEGGDLTLTVDNMENVLSKGEGFVLFVGHGSPMEWGTHPYNNYSTWIYFKLRSIMKLSNREKLPVLLVSGCHNNQFDVSILHLLKIWEGTELYDYIYWREISPVCWGWLLARHGNGGSIATLGATGLDYGGSAGDGPFEEVPDSVPDGIPDCIQYLGGWLNPHFFEVYKNGTTILGETFVTSIVDYLNRFPIDWNHDFQWERPYTIDRVNCKKIQVWTLFGDPSLQIGGYQ